MSALIGVKIRMTFHAIAVGTPDKGFMQKRGMKGRLPQFEDKREVHPFFQVTGHRPEMAVRTESMTVLIVL
jgi:hypothetical protein